MTSTNDHAPAAHAAALTPGSTLLSATLESQESLLTMLQVQDALGALLRAQFHIETRIHRVLEQHLRRAEELPPLTYQQRVRLAVALGMDDAAVPALLLIGQLRDVAVSSGSAGLDPAAVDQLFGVLARTQREAVLAWHDERSPAAAFRDAPPLQRFIIIAAALHASLGATAAAGSAAIPASSAAAANEVVTFEWTAPQAPAPRRARDFASKEALYSWLIVSD